METQELTELEVEFQTPDDEEYCEPSSSDPFMSLCGDWELMGPEIPDCECIRLCPKCIKLMKAAKLEKNPGAVPTD